MRQRQEDLFLDVLEQNQQKLFRVCLVYASDGESAKDLFQEVLVQLWKSMKSFQGKSALATWMYRVTLNVCLRSRHQQVKRQRPLIRLDSLQFVAVSADEDEPEINRKLLALRHCIHELEDGDRALVALYLEGLAYRDIAQVLGISENYVAVKVKRVKEKLLHCINKQL